jgi:hypothetical protein
MAGVAAVLLACGSRYAQNPGYLATLGGIRLQFLAGTIGPVQGEPRHHQLRRAPYGCAYEWIGDVDRHHRRRAELGRQRLFLVSDATNRDMDYFDAYVRRDQLSPTPLVLGGLNFVQVSSTPSALTGG